MLEAGTQGQVARQQRVVSELLDTFGVLFDAVQAQNDAIRSLT